MCIFTVKSTGRILLVDQNSSRDHVDQLQIEHDVLSYNETQKMSTQDIFNSKKATWSLDAETTFSMWEPPYPVIGESENEDMDYDFEAPNYKLASIKKYVIICMCAWTTINYL